jgi:hypothetical protein
MTVRTNNTYIEQNFDKLSIQVSLNGLSFCVLDTINNSIRYADTIVFEEERSPYGLQKGLVTLLEKHSLHGKKFSEVIVVHRNNLFSLVPKSLFDSTEIANYLKFNTKMLVTDHIDYDEIEGHDIINVYVPFVNVNNYIYELFGEFTFKHNGTVMIESLLNGNTTDREPTCYVHIAHHQIDITVLANKKLVLFNSFKFNTKEDLLYYLLFTMEQLNLDTESTKLKLFGAIEEGDEFYDICFQYIKNVSIFSLPTSVYPFIDLDEEAIDFTLLNSL